MNPWNLSKQERLPRRDLRVLYIPQRQMHLFSGVHLLECFIEPTVAVRLKKSRRF